MSAAELRSRHDHDAFERAKRDAAVVVRQLLRALATDAPPDEMAATSKAALHSVGLLWETSARLCE